MFEVTLDNGECDEFDVKPYLKGEWFLELKAINICNQVQVAGLSVAWLDGQDIAPDCLYHNLLEKA